MPTPPNRRQFLAATAASGVAAALPRLANAAAGETKDLRVAVIGLNGRGKKHIAEMAPNLVALCDVDQGVLADQAGRFAERHGRTPETETDYRRLVERDDIDAVTIATPNHTHTPIAIAAMAAGKHVYVEKPVSHNVWEGRQLVAAARKYHRIAQCGTQSRSHRALQQAVAWVQGGGLGEIQYALGTCYKPRPSIGKREQPIQIPSDIDYDLWCGPAEKQDLYRDRLHYDWHWDYNTGAGDMGNQGIHQMDVARWFLGEDGLPPRVLSIGGRLGYDDAGDTANTQTVLLDYPSAPLIFETRGLPRDKASQQQWKRSMDTFRGSRIGVLVQCEGGYVFAPDNYSNAWAYDLRGEEIKHWTGGGNPFANFLSAVAAGDASRLNSEVSEGHISSALCHVGNVSHVLGEQQTAGDIAGRIAGNELFSYSFDRMASHLRANNVSIDREANLTYGAELVIDPTSETVEGAAADCPLWKRVGRAGHEIPSIESV